MRLPLIALVCLASVPGLHSQMPAPFATDQASPDATATALNLDNPLGDSIQTQNELTARRLYVSPEAWEATQTIAQEMLAEVRPLRPDSYTGFLGALEQLAFAYTVVATDNDAGHPHILHLEAQIHEAKNVIIPSTLDLLNNPDVIYRRAALDSSYTYTITGRRYAVSPADNSFSILDQTHATVANLTGASLTMDANGVFTITLDNTPGDGTGNHLQLPAGLSQLLIRDTLSDQTIQRPDHLTIERTGGPQPAPALTFQDLRAKVGASIVEGHSYFTGLNRLVQASGVNTFAQPVIRSGGGELITQANSTGHILLGDDEAFVLTLRPGGATYMTVAATNIWQVETDFVHHTTSLNNTQAIPNADGTYTFVISLRDPGIYNWIDTVGVHETIVQPRWQGLSATVSAVGGPAVISQALVKLSQLHAYLPANTVYVAPPERARQIEQRTRSFSWRRPTG